MKLCRTSRCSRNCAPAGMTEWIGWVQPFRRACATGSAAPTRGRACAERLWLVFSASTDRPGGFRDQDVAYLRNVLPVFAVAVKATSLRGIGHGLLAAYLGNDPASRVLSGTVLRGEVQSVEAVVFFTDLRGFTALADTMPGRDLIALLDDLFHLHGSAGGGTRGRSAEVHGRRHVGGLRGDRWQPRHGLRRGT